MTAHIGKTSEQDLRRQMRAARSLGIATWVELRLLENRPLGSRPPCDWADDARLILAHAQRIYETRAGFVGTPAPVLVFVDETACTPRYAELLVYGETRGVRLVLVACDEASVKETAS